MSVVETTFIPSAQDIYDADDSVALKVVVPEWKNHKGEVATFWLRQLPAFEAMALRGRMDREEEERAKPENRDKQSDGMFYVVIACAVDAEVNGKPIFTQESLEPLRKKNLSVLNRLQTAALAHNGMIRDAATAVAAIEAVQAAKKDSVAAPSDGSRTS